MTTTTYEIRKVDNGYILSNVNNGLRLERIFANFESLVQDLAFRFDERNVGQEWVPYAERNDGK